MTTYTLWGDIANLWCTNPKETDLLIIDTQHPEWGEIEIGAVKQISFYDREYIQLHEDLFSQIYPEDRITDILGDFFSYETKRDSLKRKLRNEAAIVIKLKPKLEQQASIKGYRSTWFDGYYAPQTFTADYIDRQPYPGDDYRRTLYWNPNVETDSEGHATITFRNNSTNHAWKAVVAGQNLKDKTYGFTTITIKKEE